MFMVGLDNIEFSYQHASCCSIGNPPKVWVSNKLMQCPLYQLYKLINLLHDVHQWLLSIQDLLLSSVEL